MLRDSAGNYSAKPRPNATLVYDLTFINIRCVDSTQDRKPSSQTEDIAPKTEDPSRERTPSRYQQDQTLYIYF